MGNDGGSIPTRRELVKEAARNPTTTELKATQNESQAYHWSHDPITRQFLSKPIVSDSNGKLYNKDSILEFLLPSDSPEGQQAKEEAEKILLGSVKSLKDVVEVKFEVEKEAAAGKAEVWTCPITSSRLGPGTKACYIVPCGHAFSGVALKEVARTDEKEAGRCLVCDVEFAPNDVIPILPVDKDDVARLALRVKTLREKGLTHSLKKAQKEKGSKKRKKGVVDDVQIDEVPLLVPAKENGKIATPSANGTPRTNTLTVADREDKSMASGIRNSGTASLTAKVMAEQEKNKKRRLDNDNLKSLFSNRDPSKPHGRSSDFMTRGFDIPAGAKR